MKHKLVVIAAFILLIAAIPDAFAINPATPDHPEVFWIQWEGIGIIIGVIALTIITFRIIMYLKE